MIGYHAIARVAEPSDEEADTSLIGRLVLVVDVLRAELGLFYTVITSGGHAAGYWPEELTAVTANAKAYPGTERDLFEQWATR